MQLLLLDTPHDLHNVQLGSPTPYCDPACPCRALGKVEEAITHYIERIRLGGWAEERFMSALNIADQAKLQWEAGQLISPQVCVGGRHCRAALRLGVLSCVVAANEQN